MMPEMELPGRRDMDAVTEDMQIVGVGVEDGFTSNLPFRMVFQS